MASPITIQNVKDHGIMPGDEVDRFESDFPGVILQLGSSCYAYVCSYAQKRHETPFNVLNVPEAIIYHVVQLVTYKMYLKRGFNPSSEQDQPIKANYDESMQWLKDLAKGLVEIPRDADLTPDVDEMGPLFQGSNDPYEILDDGYGSDGSDCGC